MFKNRMFLAVVSGHFVVDLLNSMGAVLLAVLREPLGLSYAQIGTALTIYLLIGSLSQPLFGWISDKLSGQRMLLAGISVLWMGLFYALVALAPSWAVLLPFFLLAPLGSGLFHPVGTAVAGVAVPERAASATSLFFFFGQAGLAVGPFLAGALAGSFGSIGLIPLTLTALLPAALMFSARRGEALLATQQRAAAKNSVAVAWAGPAAALIAAFVVLVALRSSIQSIYQSYLPQLFEGRDWSPALFGLMAGVFMGAGAIGQVISGTMADRYGMRAAIIWPLLLSVPAGLLCIYAPSVIAAFIGCAAAGMLIGGQHSVLVVYAQRLLPVKQGLAAGLILGFTFASGAIGTWLAGYSADSLGLATVMQWATFAALPCALLALCLPGRLRPTAAAATSAQPASAD